MSIHSKGTTKGRHDAVVHVGTPSPTYKDWVRTNVFFHGFAEMSEARGKCVKSPDFFCLGYKWSLALYPRGDDDTESDYEGAEYVGVYLNFCSSSCVKVEYGFAIKDFTTKTAGMSKSGGAETFKCADALYDSCGYSNFMSRNK